jgi:Tfp pilus assembly protein PilF
MVIASLEQRILPSDEKTWELARRYREAVAAVEGNTTSSEQSVISIVTAREALARAIEAASVDGELLLQVGEDDRKVLGLATAQRFAAHDLPLAALRGALAAPEAHWWLSLDALSKTQADEQRWYWIAASGLLFSLAVALAAEIAGRFLKDGPDLFGTVSTVLQAVIALFTGAAFTKAGSGWIKSVMKAWHIDSRHRALIHATVALLFFCAMLAFRFGLPAIARVYNDIGVEHQARGSPVQAADALRRAITLDPDYELAHYNLGSVYEDLWQPDRALTAYRTAVLLGEPTGRAANNLARMIILDGKNVPAAVEILNVLIAKMEAGTPVFGKDQVQAGYKNRGWALLALKERAAAEKDLAKAIRVRGEMPAAHCLMAKLYTEHPQSYAGAIAAHAWGRCLAYASLDTSLPPLWIIEARRALASP